MAVRLAAALVALVVLATPAGADAKAKNGGTLVVALTHGEPTTLDPTLSAQLNAVEIYRTMCEKLYDVDGNLNVVPQLAAALPVVSNDKLTYTIRLRRGVRFNDGTPLKSQAVAATIRRNQTMPGSTRAADLAPIRSVTTPSPYTVVLHLSSPFTPLPVYLAAPAAAIMSPTQLEKLGEAFGRDPVCVGPFMYASRVVGDSVTVVRSPYYYDRKDVHLNRIVFKFMDSTLAADALRAGDIDAADAVSTTELPAIRKTRGLRVIEADGLGYDAIAINLGNHGGVMSRPYGNVGTSLASSPMLRKAFEEAIDRKALARLLQGGIQPDCTPISPVSVWSDRHITCTPYDPADARRLVAASGVAHPTVRLLSSSSPDSLLRAQFVQAGEEDVGIDVVIDTDASLTSRELAGDYDAAIDAWSGGIDPDRNMYDFLATYGSKNSTGYSNPRLDLVLSNGRKSLSDVSRRTLFHVAQQIVLGDRPYVYLDHPIVYGVVSTRVSGVQEFADTHLRVWSARLN